MCRKIKDVFFKIHLNFTSDIINQNLSSHNSGSVVLIFIRFYPRDPWSFSHQFPTLYKIIATVYLQRITTDQEHQNCYKMHILFHCFIRGCKNRLAILIWRTDFRFRNSCRISGFLQSFVIAVTFRDLKQTSCP